MSPIIFIFSGVEVVFQDRREGKFPSLMLALLCAFLVHLLVGLTFFYVSEGRSCSLLGIFSTLDARGYPLFRGLFGFFFLSFNFGSLYYWIKVVLNFENNFRMLPSFLLLALYFLLSQILPYKLYLELIVGLIIIFFVPLYPRNLGSIVYFLILLIFFSSLSSSIYLKILVLSISSYLLLSRLIRE